MATINDNNTPVLVPPYAKAEGALLAHAAGDALGWPQEIRSNFRSQFDVKQVQVEFKKWIRRGGGRYQPYEEEISPGSYSDDTQLTLAVARCRIDYGDQWWKAFTKIELPLWTIYERGGGGATKRAAKSWGLGQVPWKTNNTKNVYQYFMAGGNGVAMRVLPHALFLVEQEEPTELMHDVVLDGTATHGHPRALVGAKAYAYAAWSLARRKNTLRFGELLDILIDESRIWGEFPKSGTEKTDWFSAAEKVVKGFEDVWNTTVVEMRNLLEIARKGIKSGAVVSDSQVMKELGCFGKYKGSGTISTSAAVYLVSRHAVQPEQGVLRAAHEIGSDTDTIAAMTGGLLGCLCGNNWLPRQWLTVQDSEYLRNTASRLVDGSKTAPGNPITSRSDPNAILDSLRNKPEADVYWGGTRKTKVYTFKKPKPLAKNIDIRSWRLDTVDGQTMYVTKVYRTPRVTRTDSHSLKDTSLIGSTGEQVTQKWKRKLDINPKDALYVEFSRLLPVLYGESVFSTRDIERAFDLPRSQVSKWLKRAVQDGKIKQISKNPLKYVNNNIQQSFL